LIVLVGLEGVLAADNALVLAIMVKHLPERERRKALFYGLAGAFIFRFSALFIISQLVNVWQLQAIGAAYLIFIGLNHLFRKFVLHKDRAAREQEEAVANGSGFWLTVLKVEIADIAFAVDSILAAVALAVTLPPTNLGEVGGMDGGQFLVVLAGGIIGLIIMRFAATYFVELLHRRPGLETAAFLIVAWVGIKLAVYTLSHPALAVLPKGFAKLPEWKLTFWVVMILIAMGGWFLSPSKEGQPEKSR